MEEIFLIKIIKISSGVSDSDVKEKVSKIFKITPEVAEKIIKTNNFIIKRGLTEELSLKYRKVLEGAGLMCSIERDEGLEKIKNVEIKNNTLPMKDGLLKDDKKELTSSDEDKMKVSTSDSKDVQFKITNKIWNKLSGLQVAVLIFVIFLALFKWVEWQDLNNLKQAEQNAINQRIANMDRAQRTVLGLRRSSAAGAICEQVLDNMENIANGYNPENIKMLMIERMIPMLQQTGCL